MKEMMAAIKMGDVRIDLLEKNSNQKSPKNSLLFLREHGGVMSVRPSGRSSYHKWVGGFHSISRVFQAKFVGFCSGKKNKYRYQYIRISEHHICSIQ
jgi:hypothetical protein